MSSSNLCEECSRFPSTTHCLDCDQDLCTPCTDLIHRGGKRKTHKRHQLCLSCSSQASHSCQSCGTVLCESCVYVHCHSSIQKLSSCNSVAVFWDLSSNRAITDKDVSETLERLNRLYTNIFLIKVYGDGLGRFRQVLNGWPVEYSGTEGVRESEAMLLDVSLVGKERVDEILVVSCAGARVKVHLTQIQAGLVGVKIWVSVCFPQLKFVGIKDLGNESKDQIAVPKSTIFRPSSNDNTHSAPDPIPTYQNFPRLKGQSYSHDLLLNFLKELADTGQIMHNSGWLSKEFAIRARLSMEDSTFTIKESERMGHVHTVERSFNEIKTIFFTCLKINKLSYESVVWTLKSLKQDEMLPTERAIQSRIKEVFDYKIPFSDWETFLESCRLRRNHSKSAQEPSPYSLFSYNSPVQPHFTLKETLDPVTKQKILLIYPKSEEWDSKDQYIKEGDVLGVKQTQDWNAFVEFLSEYFVDCKSGEDSRAIPGGRYGCAQFLKLCGNPVLRNCSLGKLSYMVQLSIDENLLRYYKTLLVWVPDTQKFQDKENNEKLATVQSKILEVLKENKEGLSLAQLPLYIKRKVNFVVNVSELGFAKLKDLLMVMPEVGIELRGTNHPFAVYRVSGKKDEEEVKRVVEMVLKEEAGISSQKLESLVKERIGHRVDWTEFKCATVEQFVERKCLAREVSGGVRWKGFGDLGKCLNGGRKHLQEFDEFVYRNPPGFS